MHPPDILVAGGGLAGLACARRLAEEGVSFLLLEGSDRPGGRVRTDRVDGFLLDRGFQVLLTGYPEARRVLDYPALDLRPFLPGALVRREGRFHRISDPFRRPLDLFSTLFSPVGTLGDKTRVAALRNRLRRSSLDEIEARPERTTLDALRAEGFGDGFIDAFFRPFLGGVFFDRTLSTSSRRMEFVLKMFSEGAAALPAAGMEAIPAQLAAGLPAGSIRTCAPVKSAERDEVVLASGERLRAGAVVRALGNGDDTAGRAWQSTVCLAFAAERAPVDDPILVLDGDGSGPVNHLCVPSRIAPGYAPAGAHLVSASVVGDPEGSDAELEAAVRRQLEGWFGDAVRRWRLLLLQRIRRALPVQVPGARARMEPDGPIPCGDLYENGSIQGALLSGRTAAEAALARLGAETCP